jgi:hypothetical protein
MSCNIRTVLRLTATRVSLDFLRACQNVFVLIEGVQLQYNSTARLPAAPHGFHHLIKD